MTNQPTERPEARIIPLRLIGQATLRSAEAAVLFRTGTRTIRPIEALLLSPILIPVTIVVLLLLLAWFVLWLAAVGFAGDHQPDPRSHQRRRLARRHVRGLDRRASP